NIRSKVAISCTVAMIALAAGAVVLFARFANSLEGDPIKGWQEPPHTPRPSLVVTVSPVSPDTVPS
ncbi:MAG TPA: hypothetical protein VF069_01250, partial [Streptosporangiaceae bacterium]